ncbi:2956_t:CDS:2 [Ambispora gerdemannii]|uniref:2956_t:CDS:1 n=1 Tax=Ambispora gerdemannii TaxID=144530 RepID=A0A9N8WF73_9GLOM|nr:2956_t:CDS:2 [Ambispora gerdemannii]
MRESNFSFPSQNRACVCITSALYDRRALDCTAILPLINSLTHLTYLTSTSPRIREILTMDGGLERLVRILKTTKANDKRSGWKWSMAFQCVANVGVRGSEAIRTRVVEAGMVPVIITVLDNFLKALDQVRPEKEQVVTALPLNSQQSLIATSPSPSAPLTTPFVGTVETGNSSSLIQMSEDLEQPFASYPHSQIDTTISISSNTSEYFNSNETNTHVDDAEQRASSNQNLRLSSATASTNVASWGSVADPEETTTATSQIPSNNTENKDILLSLQLLAYLSKYPQLRATFHNSYPPHNVFSLVEKYTHRLHPQEIQYWAGVIMRNACRKDESRGGIRQCAYMACGKWESYAREFAKCRRCRKAKYCSKACQSKAWSEGHRWWCMERHGHGESDSNHQNSQSNNQPGTTATLPTSATVMTAGHRSRNGNYSHITDNLITRSTVTHESTEMPSSGTSSDNTSHNRRSGSGSSLLVS